MAVNMFAGGPGGDIQGPQVTPGTAQASGGPDYQQWIQQLIMSLLQGQLPGFGSATGGNPAAYPGMIGQLPGGTPAVGNAGFFPGGTGFTPTTQPPSTGFNPPFPGMPLPPLPPGAVGQPSSPVQQAQGPVGAQGAPAGVMQGTMTGFEHEGPELR